MKRRPLVAMRTSQPISGPSISRYADGFLIYQGQGRAPVSVQRLSKLQGSDDAVERASRILAQAFGYGDSWLTGDFQFGPAQAWRPARRRTGDGDEGMPAVIAGLPIARRTETLEKADKAAGVGEFHHWKRSAVIAVMPRVRPKVSALGALGMAKLGGPLEDWLLMYALQDWTRWPKVRRFALAVRPDPPALEDAVHRILFRVAPVAQDVRARELGVRANTYRARTAAAEKMLLGWLERAANGVLNSMIDR